MKDHAKRYPAYDVMRIVAAFSVILMHVTVDHVFSLPMESAEWMKGMALNSVSHFGVPVFVMISGALFLDSNRQIDIKRIWVHNILRIVLVLIVWSVFYGLTDYLEYRAEFVYVFREIIDGRHHLWFIPMLAGLYMIQPVLLRWIKSASENEVRYFLVMFLLVGVLWESLRSYGFSGVIEHLDKFRDVELFCSYVGYFVMGYYIAHIGFSAKVRKIIYLLCGLSILLLPVVSVLISRHRQIPVTAFSDSFSVFVFFISIGFFNMMVKIVGERNIPQRYSSILSELGRDTFGVYLCHIALMERIHVLGEWCEKLPLVPGALIYSLLLFILGTMISAVLRRLPIAGRYIC